MARGYLGPFSTVLFLYVLPLFAQVETARITGTVKDKSGAVTPGVNITVVHTQTNREITAVANDQGRYVVPALPIGDYRVFAELAGFKRAVRSGIHLEVQETAVVDLVLEVGEVTQEIEVLGDATLLNTSEGSQGQVIDNRRIVDLPLNGRDYIQLALLAAGTVEPIGGRHGGFSAVGQRTTQNNYLLDGMDNNSAQLVGAIRRAEQVKPSVDAIQEFKVQTNSYSAEFGRSSGAVVNVTTKSGSNQFHGTLFEFHRNEVLDAKNFFDPAESEKPPFKRNQFGFSFGGPIAKDRAFFFGDYEGTRIRESRTVVSTIPTPRMRTGDFSELNRVIFDPATFNAQNRTRQPFANNIIPENRIDPVARTLMDLYPQPQNDQLVSNFTFNPPLTEDIDKFDARFDYVFNEKDTVYYRLSFHDWIFPASPNLPPPAWGGGVFDGAVQGWNTGIVWNHVFSSRWITSTRGAWNYGEFARLNPGEKEGAENLNAKYGLKGVDTETPGAFLRIFFPGFAHLGQASNGNILDSQNRQVANDTTAIHGAHSTKFGANILRVQGNSINTNLFTGQLMFNGSFTRNPATVDGGSELADFLLGMPSQFARSRIGFDNIRAWLIGAYIQDDWKVSPKLTLNLGLRYELWLPFLDREDRVGNFDVDTDPANPRLVLAQSGGTRSERTLVETDRNNLAPRIGFAYELLPQTVVRGGYGIYYTFQETLAGGITLMPPFAWTSVLNTDGITPPFLLRDGAPPDLVTDLRKATSVVLSSLERDPALGYSQHWNLNVQRLLGRDWLFEVGYYGGRGTHLMRGIPGNPAPPGPGNINQNRRFKSISVPTTEVIVSPLGPISRYEWSGNSIYHSLQSKLEKRFTSGFTFLGSYIFSRTIGDSCGSAGAGDAPGCAIQDPANLWLERALDNQHVKHRFVNSYIWDLPFGKQGRWGANWNGVLDAFLGGWSTGGIFTFASGQPYSITVSGDPANTGQPNRPDQAGDPQLTQRSVENDFNKDAFRRNRPFTFGNVGRNTMIARGSVNFDFTVLKNFQLSEQSALQFRFEAFNLTNTPHFNAPGNVLGTADFGRITSAGRPRNLQFGLKIIF